MVPLTGDHPCCRWVRSDRFPSCSRTSDTLLQRVHAQALAGGFLQAVEYLGADPAVYVNPDQKPICVLMLFILCSRLQGTSGAWSSCPTQAEVQFVKAPCAGTNQRTSTKEPSLFPWVGVCPCGLSLFETRVAVGLSFSSVCKLRLACARCLCSILMRVS